jgi:hypothetical protein
MSFDPLEACPGASGEGCPHGSVIARSRELCHTCRKDRRRLALDLEEDIPTDLDHHLNQEAAA